MTADDAGAPPGAPGAAGAGRPDGVPAVVVVDARGLRCPAPVLRAARAARAAPPGTLLTVWWTDPAARPDLAAWARMRGHALVEAGVPLAGGGGDVPPMDGDVPPGDDGEAPAPAWATTVRVAGAPPA